MKKSKILIAVLLATVMVLSVVAMTACKQEKAIELLVWAPSNAQTFYKEWAEKWAADYKDSQGRQFRVKLGIMSEGEAGTNVMNAPEDSADVFCFADDQVSKLVTAGALAAIGNPTEGAAKAIADRNVESSVEAATYDGKLYAYPMQADNCYFLYYNSEVLSEEDIKSWEGIFAAVNEVNGSATGTDRVKVQWDYGTAWYQASLFFAFGGEANETSTNFDTPEVGIKALKAAYYLSSQQDITMMSPDDAKAGLIDGTIVAGVAGSWIYSGDTGVSKNTKIKLAPLPSITVDGETKTMKSFLGSKLIGVNGQGKYLEASHALANYLTGEEVQTAKVTALSAGPSNKNSANSDAAKALPTLEVISKQQANTVAQINLPEGFWDALPTCVNAMNATDATVIGTYVKDGQFQIAEMQKLLDALKVGFKLKTAA